MIRHFHKDESGMTMALAVIMIALFSVMGAGLLVFVNTDINTMAETNRGQRAFEMADAGIKAGKAQLDEESDRRSYDGSEVDVPDSEWAESKDGKDLTMEGGSVNVQIRSDVPSTGLFRVVATGCFPEDCTGAKRKVEAILNPTGGSGVPPTYFSRNTIELSGNASTSGVSIFAMGDVKKNSNAGDFIGNQEDAYFKRWAETNDDKTYPNPYNETARSDSRTGVGALGVVDVPNSYNSFRGNRIFDKNTSVKMVENPSSPQPSNEITFPFDTSQNQLELDIEALRQEAQRQDDANPFDHYRLNPSTANRSITNSGWPSGSNYNTVLFFEFSNYSSTNKITYSASESSFRGVIVVVNGDLEMQGGGSAFNGGILIYADPDASGDFVPGRGTFEGKGNAALRGYVNATGNMTLSGTPTAGSVPALNTLPALSGGMEVTSWREVYD